MTSIGRVDKYGNRIYEPYKDPWEEARTKPKAKNLTLLYEYYAKEAGKTLEEIAQTIQRLEGKAEGIDVENEVMRLNNDFFGQRVVSPEGKGVLAGFKDGKFQVKTAAGLKIYSDDQLQFLSPLMGRQDAIDSIRTLTIDQVRIFLGPEKLKELEPTPRPVKPILKVDGSFHGQVPLTNSVFQDPIHVPSSDMGIRPVKIDGGMTMKEWLKWFLLGAALILFAGIVFYFVTPK